MVFRILTIALCTTCVVLLLRPAPPLHVDVGTPMYAARTAPGALSVVDVTGEITFASVPRLVRLAPGEWIQAVNDRQPRDDFEAGALMRSLGRRGGFLDLTIARQTGERRVLVLIH